MSILTLSLGAALMGAAPHAAPAPPAAVHALVRQDAATRVQALIASYQETQNAFYKGLQGIEDQAVLRRKLETENPLPAFIEKFRELAYASAGSEAGVTAWVWVANLGLDYNRPDEAREALAVLVNDHVDSAQLGGVVMNVRYGASALGQESARKTLRAVLAGSPHAPVQAQSQFALASLLMESEVAADKAEGQALFEAMPARYADVEGGWAERAQGMLFELQNLQVGMVAPDFSAVDTDGVAWKLSDYRGKVVVVDFWGFW